MTKVKRTHLFLFFCLPFARVQAVRPFFALLALATLASGAEPIRIHPENSKYFLFRGKPLVLVTASEHYGSVLNRTFNFERYLDDAAKHKMTLTRTFLLYREFESLPSNPAAPLNPAGLDFVTPFLRTGPGTNWEGVPIFDLDRYNPEYFKRLHRFLRYASKKGIVVELTLFSNTYGPDVWKMNPLNAINNKQGVGRGAWEEYTSLRDPDLLARQLAYARKIIQETARYDNVYYEICNEPGGGIRGHVTPEDVNAWQAEVARVVREEMAKAGKIHLLSGQEAFNYVPEVTQTLDLSFRLPWLDIVNVHPAVPATILGGRKFELGRFFSKQLKLADLAAFMQAAYDQPKPVVMDEDNVAIGIRDMTGWTIYRKRAWTTLMNGGHYDFIDYSSAPGSEAGTPASRAAIRSWMQHLSDFMRSFDFIHAKLASDWIKGLPSSLVGSGLAVEGQDYIAYLADAREVTNPNAGQPVQGQCTLNLPPGRFVVSLYSPMTGEYLPKGEVTGGKAARLDLLPFQQNVVVRAKKAETAR